MSLQPESAIPLYIQIKQLLKGQIEAGMFAVGARLPSERELADRYHVSRMTARQALRLLAQEGLTHTRVGKGTFVSAPKINHELRALTSFSEDVTLRGLQPSSRVIAAEVRPADNVMADRLRIPSGAEIVVLSRVRRAGGHPLALEISHIPHARCPQLLARYDFSQVSLYEVLRRDYGLKLVWADQVIETRLPKPDECAALTLDKNVPVLSFTRVTFNEHDHPVEFVRSVYRGDQYQLRVILRYSEHQVR